MANPMVNPIQTLIGSGTKLWVDSVDPKTVRINQLRGATGATANPAIISKIIQQGSLDGEIVELLDKGRTDDDIAWLLTDRLVSEAQSLFLPVYVKTRGDDGYVSFELDPLIEAPELSLPHDERVRRYIELGKKWSNGQHNRLIKVPATDAGVDAMEELAASGVPLNVTLMFTLDQCQRAREAIWRGARKDSSALNRFKSVYSIFVSRIDVYTAKHVPSLSAETQGQVGIAIAKRLWRENRGFWKEMALPLKQEIVFASTGTKNPDDDPAKYLLAFAGSDIETNPPATNEAFQQSGRAATPNVEVLPADELMDEVDRLVDMGEMENILVKEGIRKFAEPQKALLELIASKREILAPMKSNH